MPKVFCEKCGKEYLNWSFLGEPDENSISALVVHSYRIVDTPFGKNKIPDEKCFLTLDEFNAFFGKPVVKCEDCTKWGCGYCKRFNNRPNFLTKKNAEEEDDEYASAILWYEGVSHQGRSE